MRKIFFVLSAVVLLLTGCAERWSAQEKCLIASDADTLHVYTLDNAEEAAVLRSISAGVSPRMVRSSEYKTLAAKMIATVTSPSQDGVGIAGPQVGILRRIVAVQRFDKPGEPFEVYPDIRITAFHGEPVPGPEGCLSVPDRRGEVNRWQDIEISYCSPVTFRDTTEHITGFTAVIFQHECDHLDGILYIDKLCAIRVTRVRANYCQKNVN